ncbi:putative LPS assembly protein LptD [Chryseolinea lacunae]|uniref:LPS-assembly protein LptD n=1 Tax=Chryseolinea lacunae TaxID=2801331 RepID=A0ABS1KV04_9BACT|nr:LPS-assembly protein LptD [Chryseolinea lacunae]
MRYFIAIIFTFLLIQTAVAQVEPRVNSPRGVLPYKKDSLATPPPDSLSLPADSLRARQDTVKVPPAKGEIETTINYSARDSIRAQIDGKMVWLYGDAKIVYGEVELEAEEIVIDYANSTLTAHGTRDSLGNRIGYPIFKNGQELYETKDIIYNFKTKRARISEVVTQQGEAYISGDVVFKNEKGELLSRRNSYTTCNLEHPHFRIRATKTKAIPNDKIVAGPFYMEFNDIPLPIGFLFGMFPSPRRSASGIIVPAYGEEKRRGFNLRGGGYFFDISEYVKLALTADIYSRGGHALYANSSYVKRYRYSGTVNFAYSKNPDSDDKIETANFSKDFRLTWSHSPQSKGTGRFSASVNAATTTFNQNNFLSYGTAGNLSSSSINNITAKLSSNVSYSKRLSGTPFSLGINLNHNQDLQTKQVDLLLPSLSLNMVNIYPFQSKSGKTNALDNFSVGYAMVAQNRVTNNLGRFTPTAAKDSIAPFTSGNFGTFFSNGKKGIRHSVPTSFSFKALRFFTMSPSVSFEQKFYDEQQTWAYNEDKQLVKVSSTKGFNAITNYSFSMGTNTRIYGMYFVKNKLKKVKAIRHVVNPSISYSYTPDFRMNPKYFQALRDPTDTTGKRINFVDRYQGSVYGGSSQGHSSAIGFGIGNNLEMKVQGPKDSVARKVMLLNNFSISSSYNMIADSFKLAPFSMAANTNLLDNLLNMNLSATLDPYRIDRLPNEDGTTYREKKRDDYAWKSGSIGRITSATLALSTNLNPKARAKENTTKEKIGKSDMPEQEKQFLLQNPDAYVDFDIPWSMNLSYNLGYSNPVRTTEATRSSVTQTLTMSGDVSLSEKWKVTYSSGYHFEQKAFTQTNLGIARDLHCWTMRLNWTPFGPFQQFYFVINVKSTVLQDLKLERRKPFFDNL